MKITRISKARREKGPVELMRDALKCPHYVQPPPDAGDYERWIMLEIDNAKIILKPEEFDNLCRNLNVRLPTMMWNLPGNPASGGNGLDTRSASKQSKPCPKCRSTNTTSVEAHPDCDGGQDEMILKCRDCGHRGG